VVKFGRSAGGGHCKLGRLRRNIVGGLGISYYVYVLRSLKDQDLYVGYTKNLSNRTKRHNEGRVPETKYRLTIEIRKRIIE